MLKDLLLIILGAIVSGAYFSWQEYRRKKAEKKQERLNTIRLDIMGLQGYNTIIESEEI